MKLKNHELKMQMNYYKMLMKFGKVVCGFKIGKNIINRNEWKARRENRHMDSGW